MPLAGYKLPAENVNCRLLAENLAGNDEENEKSWVFEVVCARPGGRITCRGTIYATTSRDENNNSGTLFAGWAWGDFGGIVVGRRNESGGD